MPSSERVEQLERRRMSYDEYLALPEWMRAEWVDGEVVVSPPPSYHHQRISLRLARLIEDSIPGLYVVEAAGLHLPGDRERVPDIMVLDHQPDQIYVDYSAVIVVEILSPSSRSEDTILKSAEYLTGGTGQYWTVDPAQRTVDVFRSVDLGWELVAGLDDARPVSTVPVPPHGEVSLDLVAVLAA